MIFHGFSKGGMGSKSLSTPGLIVPSKGHLKEIHINLKFFKKDGHFFEQGYPTCILWEAIKQIISHMLLLK